jgi:hypothetical protein
MGAPTSAIIAETFIQNLEHNQMYNILTKYNIIGYFRYVDDILIIYDINKTHIDTMINEFNTFHPTINFTIENEESNKLNFLDLTIHRKHNKLDYTIQGIPKRCIHIIIRNINLVYTSFWDILYIGNPQQQIFLSITALVTQ